MVFHRPVKVPVGRAYLSTGIHGDEPAGPVAMARLLADNQWPEGWEIWALPCLNPSGCRLHRRENEAGQDLNRDYRHRLTPEVDAHIGWLEAQPRFDLALCLHEDWEANGFYVYELNPCGKASLAAGVLAAVKDVCPIETARQVDGRKAEHGLIRPAFRPAKRLRWPEAFYLTQNKTDLCYTLEAPSDFPLATRVNALVTGARAALFGA